MSIQVLDCTLRDGGYVNNWSFSNSQIVQICTSLAKSNVEIVEIGYLNNKKGLNKDSTLFISPDSINKLLVDTQLPVRFVAMIDLYSFDIEKLPDKDTNILDGIRIAFHKNDSEDAFRIASEIKKKGYKVFVQPMVTKNYSKEEFISLVEAFNNLEPYAFYIVDSYGSMTLEEFNDYAVIANQYLRKSIHLGYHSHNNMQLAFSNAIHMALSFLDRDLILDSSIFGMGRGAGNLNTELITNFLNSQFRKKYKVNHLLETIDENLMYLFQKKPWGFSPAQYLSAAVNCHPNYASFLVNKKVSHISAISKILERIPDKAKPEYDQKLIEQLHQDFIIENTIEPRGQFSINKNQKIILIASGSSVTEYIDIINQKYKTGEYILIGMNHKPSFECDYYFFSNQQRFDKFKFEIDLSKVIISSNVISSNLINIVLDFILLAQQGKNLVLNSTLMFTNFLVSKNIPSVSIAGLDGFQEGSENYNYEESSNLNEIDSINYVNDQISKSLDFLSKKIDIRLLTPSIFSRDIQPKVLGVIPARYKSSRFEGKPLACINGIPMIKRTFDQVKSSEYLDYVCVATDDDQIFSFCQENNVPVVMTDPKHPTGTDRVAEVANKLDFDLYVNIQGDEPVIDSKAIQEVVETFRKNRHKCDVYGMYKKIKNKEEIESNSIIKTLVNEKGDLVYMSRHAIPFNKSSENPVFYKQVCVYGFSAKALSYFSKSNKTINEKYEDIELLRFVDLGIKVKMIKTSVSSIAVDYPDDIKKVEEFLRGL